MTSTPSGTEKRAATENSAQPIMLARASHVLAFTEVLNALGAPLHDMHRSCGLPGIVDMQPDLYVPVPAALRYFSIMERREGIDDLGFLASRQESFGRMSSEIVRILSSAPTLFSRLSQFAALVPVENTHCRVTANREGDDFRINVDLACPNDLEGHRFSEWIQLIVVLNMVRQSVAPSWQPAEITFRSRFLPSRRVREYFPNTRILVGQPHTSFKTPATLIFQTPLRQSARQGSQEATDDVADRVRQVIELDFPGSLKLALRIYLRGGHPDVRLAAEIAGTSVRTLQRRLATFGLTYAQLVLQTRFEVASELLKDKGLKSSEVAFEVGYTDSSNFARGFRSVAGVSPEEYRRQFD